MLRRMCVSLTALAIATAPALTLLATSGTASAAPRNTNAAHVAVAHGAIRNGGVDVHAATPGSKPLRTHGGVFNASTTSTNWSGYAAHGGTYTTVSATWVQPAGSCTSATRYSSFWVGLDGYTSNSVEQTGTDTDCSGGRPVYYGWYEMYPNPSFSFGSTINAGDTISASVTFSGTSSYTLKLSDVTRGWTSTTTKSLSGAPRSSAEVIIEAPCCTGSGGILPLANFGTVHLSNSLVNGSSIGSFSPDQITMVNSSGADKDTVSALSGGTSFSATWVRAS
jgi:Peptidase A4 family